MARTLFAIDDDPSVLNVLRRVFERDGWEVSGAPDGRTALAHPALQGCDVIVQDLDLPGIGGLDLLDVLLKKCPDASVIVLTGYGNIPQAVEAIRMGAENFLSKPPQMGHLLASAERARERSALRRENRRMIERTRGASGFEVLERAPALRPLARDARSVAESDATVLLQGETGTGKGWLARLIHQHSPRARRHFVELNCAGLNATFLESELFGHEKGAFTDARSRKSGLLEVADGGSLFLDEIGEMDLRVQPKLLTALESCRFRRLGGTDEIEVDVRIIAATNRSLKEDAATGRFREDLYYRLSMFPLHLPPLRERGRAEIIQLAYDLLKGLVEDMGRKRVRISDRALELLTDYPWPGNVRELRNVLERALIVAPAADELRPEHLPADFGGSRAVPSRGGRGDLDLSLEEIERRHVLRVLEHYGGNRTRAARALGIGRRTLYDRLKRYEDG